MLGHAGIGLRLPAELGGDALTLGDQRCVDLLSTALNCVPILLANSKVVITQSFAKPQESESKDFSSSLVHFSVRGSVPGTSPTVSVPVGNAHLNAFLMTSTALLIQLIFTSFGGLYVAFTNITYDILFIMSNDSPALEARSTLRRTGNT